MNAPVVGKQRTKNKDFSIGSGTWSPDGSRIAFSATVNPDLIQGVTSDIYVLTLATTRSRRSSRNRDRTTIRAGRRTANRLVFLIGDGPDHLLPCNSRLAIVPAEGGTPRSITDSFDEQPGFVEWNADGIYFTGLQKTASHLFRVDPATAKITRVSGPRRFDGRGIFADARWTPPRFQSQLADHASGNRRLRSCETSRRARSRT